MIKTGFYRHKLDDTYILLIVQSSGNQLTYLCPDGSVDICIGKEPALRAEKTFRNHYNLIECL